MKSMARRVGQIGLLLDEDGLLFAGRAVIVGTKSQADGVTASGKDSGMEGGYYQQEMSGRGSKHLKIYFM